METYEFYLAAQTEILRIVNSAMVNYRKLPKTSRTTANIQRRIDDLRNMQPELRANHARLRCLATAEQKKEEYFKEDLYVRGMATLDESLDALTDALLESTSKRPVQGKPKSVGDSNATEYTSAMPLPKFNLPRFSGDLTQWEEFRDRFTSIIIRDTRLSDSDRMAYLSTSLEGSARRAIAHINITDNNFQDAWRIVRDRFENLREIIAARFDVFHAVPVVSSNSLSGLQALQEAVQSTPRSLKALGREVDGWGDFYVNAILRKFDKETRMMFTDRLDDDKTPITLAQIDNFIEHRIRVLQSGDRAPGGCARSGGSTRRETRSPKRVHNLSTSSSSSSSCLYCSKSHFIVHCNRFKSLPVGKRKEFIASNRRCFLCLGVGHFLAQCTSSYRCNECKARHHILLHERSRPPYHEAPVSASSPGEVKVVSHTVTPPRSVTGTSALLATARVKIYGLDGRTLETRALLDQGSETTLVTERLAQLLRLPRTRRSTRISGVGGMQAFARGAVDIGIGSALSSTAACRAEALVVPSLTHLSAREVVDMKQWYHIKGLKLADPEPTGSQPIEVLLGADVYAVLLRSGLRKGRVGQPVAQRTALGWVLSGPYRPIETTKHHVSVGHTWVERLDADVQRFWQLESLPEDGSLAPEEQDCEDHFVANVSRESTGRYIVGLPFRRGFSGMGDSRVQAMHCLKSLERRLACDPQKESAYRAFLQEYLDLGHMSCVGESDTAHAGCYYIPHHAVYKRADAVAKIRVVFNASRRSVDGTSLNDHLLTGPRLQSDLSAILLQWRQFRYVLSADMTKMYRQICMREQDRDYQRILWRRQPSDPIREYRLNTVTYGTVCAPFLAIRVIHQLVQDEAAAFPEAGEVLKRATYVDDCLFGGHSLRDAAHKRDQLIALLRRGGFSLSKWKSNVPSLLHGLKSDAVPCAASKNFTVPDLVHILGVRWSPVSDEFSYQVELSAVTVPTKRSILSIVAKMFDPLGWLSPVIVRAKIFIQRLWQLGLPWDQPVSGQLLREWEDFRAQLPQLNHIAIPRWLGSSASPTNVQFHGFCDASKAAYAAAAYVRIETDGRSHVVLLLAKSRVAPLMSLTIPQLELCAALLLARVVRFALDQFPWPNISVFGWSDSTITIARIQRPEAKWKVFVANRVNKIRELIPQATWRHVGTKENPADIASRGLNPVEFLASPFWWAGPAWLSEAPSLWPHPVLANPEIKDSEEIEERSVSAVRVWIPWELSQRFSSWFKLVRVTAYLYRFIGRARDTAQRTNAPGGLTREEIKRARVYWLRYIQQELFAPAIAELRGGELSTSNPIASLSPFLDSDDLLRVRGRLAQSCLKPAAKHPIVLGSHYLVKMLIRDTHERMFHCGPVLLLSTLRQEFWLLRSRQLVRSVLYSCVTCTRYRGRAETQLMADLPSFRSSPSPRPFVHVGIDYAGPVLVKVSPGRGHRTMKAYISVFICMATKAIHLEVVSDYSTQAFLAAFHRFVSRRGIPSGVYSDNGTNFVGADRELTAAVVAVGRDPTVLNSCAEHNINWKFIPPSAPHFGGIWEVAVRTVKRLLVRTVGTHSLTFEELSTVLCRIEACINSRPLSGFSDNIDDFTVLTPGHFLIGAPLVSLPEPSVLSVKENRLSRWKLLQQLTEQCWRVWSSDYLRTLQQRSKWLRRNDQVYPGRLVLIITPGLPPGRWNMGRIMQCHPGQDGLVRVVTIKTATTSFKRPVTRLCLLPEDINVPDRALSDH